MLVIMMGVGMSFSTESITGLLALSCKWTVKWICCLLFVVWSLLYYCPF